MANIDWKELTISPEIIEWKQMLLEWRWLIPDDTIPIWLSTFGDWAMETKGQSVYFLDILEGRFVPIASSKLSFDGLFDDARNRNRWLMADWFQICNERGLFLAPGQCYGWKLAPALGGKFEFENIQIFDLKVYESIMGQIHRQIQNLPEGFTVSEFKTSNMPSR